MQGPQADGVYPLHPVPVARHSGGTMDTQLSFGPPPVVSVNLSVRRHNGGSFSWTVVLDLAREGQGFNQAERQIFTDLCWDEALDVMGALVDGVRL
jgi:hypothetical protein